MKRFATCFLVLCRPECALIGITMLWGGTFLLIHTTVNYCGPFFLVGLRFLIAAAVLVCVFGRQIFPLSWREVKAGCIIGIALFLGYSLQTVGLQSIPSSQSAFISAIYMPMVPLLQWLFWGRRPALTSWLGALLAFAGLVLISNPGKAAIGFSAGETVTLLSAIAIAVEIILISYFAPRFDSCRLTVIQLFAASAASFLTMPVVGEVLPQFSWIWALAALMLGLMSALIQLAMNWAQKFVSPTRASVIYAGEPVWAGIIGRLAGERLPGIALLGAAFIVAGMLIAELKWFRRKKLPR